MLETTLSNPPLTIPPLHNSTPRRVGLIMTYNQRESCIEAINSLLAQTLALDLIIVSDDHSNDGTYEFIADYFSKNGKPRNVELYQSEKNLGFIPHFNALLKTHCRDDDLIVYNAGDDISEKNRVEEFYREYVAKGKPRYFLGHSYVTSFGSGAEEILVPPIESIKKNRELYLIASAYHIGASQVFTGALFFDFGPILFHDCYEDLTLGYRALLKNAYHFIPKALLRYRVGGLSSWQKNPLEKKRERLKSTLTQRAVDSMRSGDFGALTTISECYSEYGFSMTAHPENLKIIVLKDSPSRLTAADYSISDHFSVINNVCTTTKTTSQALSTVLAKSLSENTNPMIWVVVSNLDYRNIQFLITALSRFKNTPITFDLGLMGLRFNSESEKVMKEFLISALREYNKATIHSSSLTLAVDLSQKIKPEQITYVQPLFNIDGPDPVRSLNTQKSGLIITFNPSTEHSTLVSTVKRLQKRSNCRDIQFAFINAISGEITSETSAGDPTKCYRKSVALEEYVSNFDFLLLEDFLSSPQRDVGLYFWGMASQYCIPTFLNPGPTESTPLLNGETCIFIDSTESALDLAFQLIDSNHPDLNSIAKGARRAAYFHCSVQKNLANVTAAIGENSRRVNFFSKFLPL